MIMPLTLKKKKKSSNDCSVNDGSIIINWDIKLATIGMQTAGTI